MKAVSQELCSHLCDLALWMYSKSPALDKLNDRERALLKKSVWEKKLLHLMIGK